MKKYWIYCILSKIDGKMYIGSSKNKNQRRGNHFKLLKNNKHFNLHLQRAYNTYGEDNFTFNILDEGEMNISDEELLLLEDKWVIRFDTLNEEKGYNKQLPSKQYTIKSWRCGKIGYENYLLTRAPSNLKQITSEEWILKRKEGPNFTLKIKPTGSGSPFKKRVFKIDTTSYNIIEIFNSISEASDNIDCKIKHLQEVLSKNIPDCKYLNTKESFAWVLEENFSKDFDFTVYKDKNYFNTLIKKEKSIKIIKEITIQNIETGEIKIFNKDIEIANFLQVKKIRIVELKKGFKNKGGGITTKINHVKGWKFA